MQLSGGIRATIRMGDLMEQINLMQPSARGNEFVEKNQSVKNASITWLGSAETSSA